MFGLFKKKSKIETLRAQYKKLMKEAYDLSTSNRMASDKKHAEASEIMDEIEALAKAGEQ